MSKNRKTNGLEKPDWFRQKLPDNISFGKTRRILRTQGLHTVCEEACCPNMGSCYSARTATFIIMGSRCTRNCRFCAVGNPPSGPPDPKEPEKVAVGAKEMGLSYVVVTSVTRDDLPDGGAEFFAATISELRKQIPEILIEVLIPDFQNSEEAMQKVLAARPDVINHNMETVSRLYSEVRPQADYQRSLEVLAFFRQHDPEIITKSGLMLGLGEKEEEIRTALDDLLKAGCRLLTLGQYLAPTKNHLPVARYVPPREFSDWREQALEQGFLEASCGPLVRSSYQAHELYKKAISLRKGKGTD